MGPKLIENTFCKFEVKFLALQNTIDGLGRTDLSVKLRNGKLLKSYLFIYMIH